MIATGVFVLLLGTALSGLQDRRWLSVTLFFASWIAIALLFSHHATDTLDISL
ncbi:DUF5993 family protein [Myxococcota bacterium]|nr:DUF5993 family protein [Myxococcota bacterium]